MVAATCSAGSDTERLAIDYVAGYGHTDELRRPQTESASARSGGIVDARRHVRGDPALQEGSGEADVRPGQQRSYGRHGPGSYLQIRQWQKQQKHYFYSDEYEMSMEYCSAVEKAITTLAFGGEVA